MKRALTVIACSAFLVAISAIQSCRAVKDTGREEPSMKVSAGRELYNDMLSGMPEYDNLSIKCQISLGTLSSRAQVSMIRDSFMQISFQPVFGIELFRVMLTTDSLYLLDRLNSMAAAEPLSDITGTLPEGTGITQIQSLLLGEPFTIPGQISHSDYGRFVWSLADGKPVLHTTGGKYPELKFMVGEGGTVEQTCISDSRGNTLEATYAGRKKAESAGSVPDAITIKISIPGKAIAAEAGISGMSYDWGKTFTPDTTIPKRYRLISFADYIKTSIK